MNPLEILNASVRIVVGSPTAAARPGQGKMCADLSAVMAGRTHLVGIAPTGVGKSLALLSAAAWRVIDFDERVLLSTKSLGLQSQVVEKDAPVVVTAVRGLGGREILVAVLKGVGNYLDPRKLLASAAVLARLADHEDAGALPVSDLIEAVEDAKPTKRVQDEFDGCDLPALRRLVVWGLRQYLDPASAGDRNGYGAAHTQLEWAHVSASSVEAAGADDTPLFPKALLARERVAAADIVVTNHTLLAIQAASGIPIVIGNKNYGPFDHILVDEAHALPDEVRAQGACEVSGRTILGLVRTVLKVADDRESPVRHWADDGEALADLLETRLKVDLGRDGTKRIPKDDDPLGNIGVTLSAWSRIGGKLVDPASKSTDVRTMLAARRAKGRAEELCSAVDSVSSHHSGEARWIEAAPARDPKFRSWTSAQASPVDVSGKLAGNLWVRPVDGGGPDEVEPLGVAAVSATLPQGYAFQAGLDALAREYESPFSAAYANSILFIPRATSDADIAALSSDRSGRVKFDTKKHAAWAERHIVALVRANKGSALILSATSAGGQQYAEALRRALPRIRVHSQWDGGTAGRLLAQWRDDEGSVLVGTRSMMTGVDAPGETCTLVVVDRIPRRPGNPIDDARVEQLADRLGDKWAAGRFVYAADAALLEEQAAGRLIRSTDDAGMVAVLDPRLLKIDRGPFNYPEATRRIYMKPLYKFQTRTADPAVAHEWLRDRRAALAAGSRPRT